MDTATSHVSPVYLYLSQTTHADNNVENKKKTIKRTHTEICRF